MVRAPKSRGYCEFMPTPEEVLSRGEALRWMTKMGWSEELIDQIMLKDSPDVETVRRMVYKMGPDEARRKIALMNLE